jgi:hypothetical protein
MPSEVQHESRDVPAAALLLQVGAFEFGDNGEDAKTAPIRLVARAGKPIEHWYFGKVVHDFDGMRHKNRIPVDYVHSEDEVIGYVNKFDASSGDLQLSGALVPFKDSDRATEIIYKNRLGVPYEASIDFRDSMVMEELRAGQFAEVNGNRVDGPAVIIREWTLRGVAVCPYGADPNTSSQLSSAEKFTVSVKKEEQMSEQATAEAVEAVEAKVEQQQTASEEVSPGKRYVEAFGEKGAVWFVEGKSFEEAAALHSKCQAEEIAKLKGENDDLQKKLAGAKQAAAGEEKPLDFQTGEKNEKTRKGFASRIKFASPSAN